MDVTIVLDAMGGDHGAHVTVPAAASFLASNPEARIILVGQEPLVRAEMKAAGLNADARVRVQHASEVVAMDESIATALRGKRDSSMRVAIDLIKSGEQFLDPPFLVPEFKPAEDVFREMRRPLMPAFLVTLASTEEQIKNLIDNPDIHGIVFDLESIGDDPSDAIEVLQEIRRLRDDLILVALAHSIRVLDLPVSLFDEQIAQLKELGYVVVDLDAVRRQKAPTSLLDPMNYLTGRLPVTATGVGNSPQNTIGLTSL